jgi:hypothetical protein
VKNCALWEELSLKHTKRRFYVLLRLPDTFDHIFVVSVAFEKSLHIFIVRRDIETEFPDIVP